MSSKKERSHYDLKEMEHLKNSKIVSMSWRHIVLTEMFTITQKSALLYEKVKFLTSLNPSRHPPLLLIFLQVNSAWYNLKSRGRIFFLNVQLFRYWEGKTIYGYCIHTLIQESFSVVFKHFRVLLAACAINIYLENWFYIDINKNIIFYFNTQGQDWVGV